MNRLPFLDNFGCDDQQLSSVREGKNVVDFTG